MPPDNAKCPLTGKITSELRTTGLKFEKRPGEDPCFTVQEIAEALETEDTTRAGKKKKKEDTNILEEKLSAKMLWCELKETQEKNQETTVRGAKFKKVWRPTGQSPQRQ